MKGMRQIRNAAWDRVEDINAMLDMESRNRFFKVIMKEDGITYDEAVRLCLDDPKYSLGYKMCSPSVIAMLKMRGGKERFKQWLTPEELEIFERDVEHMDFRKMEKAERKRQS